MALSIFIGLITGILSSLVTFFVLRLMRPKIMVSDKIAAYKDKDGKLIYAIKIVNLTSCVLKNVKYELAIGSFCSIPNKKQHSSKVHVGQLFSFKEIPFAQPAFDFIAKYDKNDPRKEWAVRYTTTEDILALLANNDTSFLRFSIYVESSKTEASKLVLKEFSYEDIVSGKFELGESFDIK